jgi:hypothetical protein
MKKWFFAFEVLVLVVVVAVSCADGGVDVDLTQLSNTMVYAEVYNMMANPLDYLGKTVKATGPYYATYYDATGQYYPLCSGVGRHSLLPAGTGVYLGR